MSILIVDQSIANTGWLLVNNKSQYVDSGVLSTVNLKKINKVRDMDDKARRTNEIIDCLKEIIFSAKVKILVCEEYSGSSQDSRSADGLSTTRTIVIALSNLLGIPLVPIRVREAKEALTKNKKADKTEMINAASKVCPKAFESLTSKQSRNGWNGKAEHIADAFGIFLASKKKDVVKKYLDTAGVL